MASGEAPLDLGAAPDLIATETPLTSAVEPSVPEVAPETPAPELPKAFRARAEQTRRLRRAAVHGVLWAGVASVLLGLIGAAWLFRVEVVQIFPRAAAAYAFVGSPVNVTGLQFEAVNARSAPNDPSRVLVSGAIRNIRDHEIVAPPVRVALLDEHGEEIAHQYVRLRAAPVLPGGVLGFATFTDDPESRAHDISVIFVDEDEAPRVERAQATTATGHPPVQRPLPTADAAHGAPVAPGADSAHGPAPAAAPAQDSHGAGLRPARSVASGPALEAEPLDTHPGEAVSASHHG